MGLSEEELAFYDALETNDSAVQVLGGDTLRTISRELVDTVRRNVTTDWTLRESVRAHLRALMRRILRRHGCPPLNRDKKNGLPLIRDKPFYGGAEGDRTPDLMNAIHALSHLSYSPTHRRKG